MAFDEWCTLSREDCGGRRHVVELSISRKPRLWSMPRMLFVTVSVRNVSGGSIADLLRHLPYIARIQIDL